MFLGFSGGLSFFALGPILPLIIGDFGISNGTASLLISAVPLTHAVFAIPAGLLFSHVSIKKMIVLGSVASSVPVLSFLAADSFPVLLGLRAVYSLGFVILFPATGPLFMQWFHPKELPLVNGLWIIVASLGSAISVFIAAPLSQAIGWEVTLSAFGGVALLASACWLALGKAQSNVKEIKALPATGRIWRVLRSRSALLVAAADAGPFALLTVSLAWLPTFYNEVHGISLSKAGALMGLLSLAGVVALVLASLLATRLHRRRPFLIIPGILIGFAGFATFLLTDSIALYIGIVALGFTCWFYLPVLMTIPMELYPADPNQVAVTFSVLMMIGGIATFIAPLTVGVIADMSGSFIPGLALFAILAWSRGIAGFLLPETSAAASETKPEH